MNIIGVDRAVLGVEDMQAAQRFFTEFGLRAIDQSTAGATFITQDGSEVMLRFAADAGLPVALSGGSTIREIMWAVDSSETLARIGASLERDRTVRRDAEDALHSVDDDGYAIGFRVTRRKPFAARPAQANVFGLQAPRGINARMDFSTPIEPSTIGHIVVLSPDVERAAKFYVERLGFRVTDKFKGGKGVFLRAAGSHDHHTLFIINNVSKGLHHISFHVTDFNEVMLGGKRMVERGWKTTFGPGRHTLGSNLFWYLQSPCGGSMEYAADMDRVDDQWVAGEWDYCPEIVAAWSTTFAEPAK